MKVSVSELKKRSYAGDSEREESLFFEPDIIPLIPKFIAGEEERYKGAARGTAYHKLMECLDYHRVSSEKKIKEQLEKLLEAQKMERAEAESILPEDILLFAESPIGQRMAAASLLGNLFREQPFVISNPASALNPAWPGEETVLVQGIIDAYFLEEDAIVLVDYKTDKVSANEEQRLADLYHIQLEGYAEALERMTGKKVKEKYIYSFTLGRAIEV